MEPRWIISFLNSIWERLLYPAKYHFARAYFSARIGGSATELRRPLRSQMEFGNEGNGIGNEVASALLQSAGPFPSVTWERGWVRATLCLIIAWSGLGVGAAYADDPSSALQSVSFRGQGFLVRTVDPKTEDLQLFWSDDQGHLLHDFAGLDKYVAGKGERLVFAANAGMFEPDSKPVGLLVQDEKEVAPLNLNDGQGNFYMKPNGVFLINEKHEAHIVESGDYAMLLTPAVWATQSGPLLVHGGDVAPDFNADSKNLKIRSGVGVRKDGAIVFALSRGPVNFYAFASLFLNRLKCANALYLDGDISAFDVPGLKDPTPHSFGPMFGLVEKK